MPIIVVCEPELQPTVYFLPSGQVVIFYITPGQDTQPPDRGGGSAWSMDGWDVSCGVRGLVGVMRMVPCI